MSDLRERVEQLKSENRSLRAWNEELAGRIADRELPPAPEPKPLPVRRDPEPADPPIAPRRTRQRDPQTAARWARIKFA